MRNFKRARCFPVGIVIVITMIVLALGGFFKKERTIPPHSSSVVEARCYLKPEETSAETKQILMFPDDSEIFWAKAEVVFYSDNWTQLLLYQEGFDVPCHESWVYLG